MSTLKSSQELSREEEAELNRSNKKVKESHQSETLSEASPFGSGLPSPSFAHGAKQSFKEKWIGDIPGAYVQAFDLSEHVDNEMELREGMTTVNLSKAMKQRIRGH
nr:hypothetical protein CFP56_55292 [Quercus suber]